MKCGYGSTFRIDLQAFNGSGLLSYLGSGVADRPQTFIQGIDLQEASEGSNIVQVGVLRNDAVVRDPQRIAIAMQQKSQNYASMLLPRTKHAATETSWTKNEAT